MFRKAVEIAVKAHKEQKDKSGVDYICHPLTVALKCETQEQKVVAVFTRCNRGFVCYIGRAKNVEYISGVCVRGFGFISS